MNLPNSTHTDSNDAYVLRLDDLGGLRNALTGMGMRGSDPTLETYIDTRPILPLTREEQSAYVRRYGICRKVVGNVPKAAAAQWGKIQVSKNKGSQVDELTSLINNLEIVGAGQLQKWRGVRHGFREALKLAFQSGNAALVIDADDGSNSLEAPLNLKKLKRINKLWLFDRWACYPELESIYTASQFDYFRLHTYYGSMKISGFEGAYTRIHRSRVLWFRGAELADWDLWHNQGCDDSILQSLVEAFNLYYNAISGMGRMIVDYDFVVHKISGLLARLDEGGREAQEKLNNRLSFNQTRRSLYHDMVVDREFEDIGHNTRNASGYGDLADRVKAHLLASSDYPPAVLFGEFSAGLDASGKETSEKQLWNETIGQVQDDKFHSNLMELLTIACQASDSPTKGKVPEGLSWQWLPVYPPTPEETAAIELNFAQVATTYSGTDAAFPFAILKDRFARADSPLNLPDGYAEYLDRQIEQATAEQPEEEEVDFSEFEGSTEELPVDEEIPTEEVDAAVEEDVAVEEVPIEEETPGRDPFNGAQVSSLVDVVKSVGLGEIPRDSALQIISLAFSISPDEADSILGSAGAGFKPALTTEKVAAVPEEGEEPAAEPIDDRTDAIADSLTDVNSDRADSIPTNQIPRQVTQVIRKGLVSAKVNKVKIGTALIKEAKAIAQGNPPSPEKISAAVRYFAANSRSSSAPKGSPERITWDLWGGKEGRIWFSELYRQMHLPDRADSATSIQKRVKLPNGAIAGLTHLPGDLRHGTVMGASYGMVLGTYGQAEDGLSIDIYLGNAPNSTDLWKVSQVTPDGDFDESKYIAHCENKAAAKDLFVAHAGRDRFGFIQAADWDELTPQRSDSDDSDDRLDARWKKTDPPTPCGKGWQGMKPPGCKRAERKSKKATIASDLAKVAVALDDGKPKQTKTKMKYKKQVQESLFKVGVGAQYPDIVLNALSGKKTDLPDRQVEDFGKVDLSGLDDETSKIVSEALKELAEESDRLNIPRINSFESWTPKDGDYSFAAQYNGLGGISVNSNSFNRLVKMEQEDWENERRGSVKNIPVDYPPYSVSAAMDTGAQSIRATLIHEFGHHVSRSISFSQNDNASKLSAESEAINFLKYYKRAASQEETPTIYANEDTDEFFAENYALYYLGYKNSVNPVMKTFLDEIYAGGSLERAKAKVEQKH